MTIDIVATPAKWNFAPASVVEEISQNVLFLLLTPRGTVPLHRAMGLDIAITDQPFNRAQQRMAAEVIGDIHKYEPRAAVRQVSYGGNAPDGALTVTIEI